MCIYRAYILDNEKTTVADYSQYQKPEDIDNLKLSNIVEQDSREDFIETEAPKILHEYIQKSATSSKWPKMNYTNSDKNKQGYVSTTNRWFHFKTSSKKYIISTSWIRVVELYAYLSPHYASHETTSSSNMNPYLNKGFLLQGKHLIGRYSHSVIVVRINGEMCFCGHSKPRRDEPMQTFYKAFHKYRVLQTY